MALFSIGDAILKFVADTTELDTSFDRIQQESAAKLAPVQAQAAAVGAALDGVAESATTAGAAMSKAGTEGAKATSAVSESYVKLAQATAANQQAQQSVRIALQNVKQTGGESAQAITLLAQAQEKAALAAKNLAEAQMQVKAETEAVTVAEKEAGTAAVLMGEEMTLAGEQATFSMTEAKGTIALVGEEVGVRVPRHLRSFIAELPGVGKALEAAFSAVAILVLVQLIVEATEKLTEFISETFIYTERDKEMYAATVELNKALAEQSTKLTELQKAYSLIGLEGPAKTKKEFMDLTDEVHKNEEALRLAQNTLAKYRLEQQSVDFSAVHSISEDEANKAAETILRLTSLLKTQYQEQANLGKTFDNEDLAQTITHNQSIISADKSLGDSRIALLQAGSRLRLLAIKAGFADELAEDQRFAQMKYELELATLQREKENLSKDPTKNADQIRAKNAEIEDLENQHEANLIDIHIKGMRALQAAIAQAGNVTETSQLDAIIPPPSDVAARVQQVSDILQQFGIKSGQTWTAEVVNAEAALAQVDEAVKRNEATYAELLQVKERVAQAKLGQALNNEDFQNAAKYRDELEGIRHELVLLGIETDKDTTKQQKWNLSHRDAISLIDKWALDMRKTRGELSQTQQAFDNIIGATSEAFGNAISQWILGQESLGNALRKGLAAEAANIAGRAAMWGLYWTAWGIADSFWNPARAGGDFAAAAEFFAVAALAGGFAYAINPRSGGSGEAGAPAGAKPIDTTPVSQTQSSPTQTTQVQRFATGGLILGPTLAVIGDAASSASALSGPGQREAAIPLDDERATSAIAQALMKHMPTPIVRVGVHGQSIRHLIKKISSEVENGGVQLTASRARAVRKKS